MFYAILDIRQRIYMNMTNIGGLHSHVYLLIKSFNIMILVPAVGYENF